jgi:hypothetical protein
MGFTALLAFYLKVKEAGREEGEGEREREQTGNE